MSTNIEKQKINVKRSGHINEKFPTGFEQLFIMWNSAETYLPTGNVHSHADITIKIKIVCTSKCKTAPYRTHMHIYAWKGRESERERQKAMQMKQAINCKARDVDSGSSFPFSIIYCFNFLFSVPVQNTKKGQIGGRRCLATPSPAAWWTTAHGALFRAMTVWSRSPLTGKWLTLRPEWFTS